MSASTFAADWPSPEFIVGRARLAPLFDTVRRRLVRWPDGVLAFTSHEPTEVELLEAYAEGRFLREGYVTMLAVAAEMTLASIAAGGRA